MPAQEVGEAFVAIRATAAGFAQQARTEVNQALTSVRESATVQIRAQVDQTGARAVQQSFAPVVGGARQMGSEVEGAYNKVGSSSHSAYERVQLSHDGIRARFGETLRAASAMGGGIALAYGAFSQGRQAIQVTNELAHATMQLSTATGLNAKTASAYLSVAQAQGIASTTLQTSFSSLARVTSTAQDAFAKSSGAAQVALEKVHTEQIRVNSDVISYHDAIEKYGQGSSEATSKLATLSSAQDTLKGYLDKTTTSVTGSALAFSQLGITQQQLQAVQGNLPAELGLIADKFQAMGAGTDRSRIAQQLFGRSYSQVLPLLAQGSQGLQQNVDIATQYGATLSGSTLKSMEQLRTEQTKLNLEMTGLRVRIATAVEPALISLGGIAVQTASKFGDILSGGIGLAKKAMDDFLKTPYGQGLSTIAGDAVRFATQVRQHFEKTLERPLAFSHLFDSFKTDLLNWLPGATRDFWTQLNQDLFAPGKEITVPIRGRIEMRGAQEHAPPPTQLVGAGIFPGSNFTDQGKKLGSALVSGMLDGLKAAFSGGNRLGQLVGEGIQKATEWIVNGGGAAKILSGALQIANAFLSTLFEPSFWLTNWKVILELAITLFPYDKIFVIPGRILEALGLSGLAMRIIDRLFGPIIDAIQLLPTRIGSALIDLGKWLGDAFQLSLPDALQGVGRIGNAIIRFMFDLIAKGFTDELPKLVRDLFTNLSQEVDGATTTLFGKVLGLFEGGLINKLFVLFVKFVANATLVGLFQQVGGYLIKGLWAGIEDAASWLEKQITHFFDEFINWVEDKLGIHSPSTVAKQWGSDIVNGLVNGLKALPGDITKIVSKLPGIIWNAIQDFAAAEIRGYGIVLSAARNLGERLITGVIGEAKKLPGQVKTQVEHLGQMISGLESWLLREGVKIGKAILNGVINGAENLGGDLKNSIEGHVKDALSSLNPFSPIEHGADIYIAQPIMQGTTDALQPFQKDLTQAIINPLRQSMAPSRNQASTLGNSIATGVRAGMNPLQGMMTNAIVTASNGAITSAKRALGISSPSQVYADQIGKPLADGIIHGMGGLEKGLAAKVTAAARSAQTAAGGVSITPGGTAAVGSNQALGRSMMLAHGWPASQWGALQALWNRESGWNQFAKNASSGAYGIPQSLPASKMASAGADWLTNAATQIRWGLDYIAGRYGSPGAAWAHEEQVGWYHSGGVVPGAPTQNVPIMARGGEVVFTPEQMKMLAGRGSVNVGQVNIFESKDGRQSAEDFLAEIADRIGG